MRSKDSRIRIKFLVARNGGREMRCTSGTGWICKACRLIYCAFGHHKGQIIPNLIFSILLMIPAFAGDDGTEFVDLGDPDDFICGTEGTPTLECLNVAGLRHLTKPAESAMVGPSGCKWIENIETFLDTCPQRDRMYERFIEDFQIRRNGIVVDPDTIPCTEPVSEMPIEEYSDELTVLQAIRAIYYMGRGHAPGFFPWTDGTMYDWMRSRIGGFNICDSPSDDPNCSGAGTAWAGRCCNLYDERILFQSRADDEMNRDYRRTWSGLAGKIQLYAHEVRHRDDYPHVGCSTCPAPNNCDQNYDESSLSTFSVSYWLQRAWANGDLYAGYACLPSASVIAQRHVNNANGFSDRFCGTAPPEVSVPTLPGGECPGPRNDFNENGLADECEYYAGSLLVTSGLLHDIIRQFCVEPFCDYGSFLGSHLHDLGVTLDVAASSDGGSGANLYGANLEGSRIWRLNLQDGGFDGSFVSSGSGGLNAPTSLQVGPDGLLYAASSSPAAILRYERNTGAFLNTFVPAGSGGLSSPGGMSFGPGGHLYVTNGSSVLFYDGATGAWKGHYVLVGSGGLSNARSLTFGPDGFLYVVSAGTGDILKYEPVEYYTYDKNEKVLVMKGIFVGTFVSAASGGLTDPRGLTFGPDGQLYVTAGSDVLRYNGQTGAFMDSFVRGAFGASFWGLTFGDGDTTASAASQTLFVAETNFANVYLYDGKSGESLGAVDHGSGGLVVPRGLAYGPDCNLYVVSRDTSSILRYDGVTGAFLDEFVSPGSGGLRVPQNLRFGSDGLLYVVDSALDGVLRFDSDTGAFVDMFVESGSGGLDQPLGFCFAPDGNLYVSGGSNRAILRFDGKSGAFLDTFVTPGSGGLSAPQDVVFGPDRNLYVASFGTSSVLRYDGLTGEFIDAFVPSGSGGLNTPVDLFFHSDGMLYVTSQNNDRVLRYDGQSGAFVDEYVPASLGVLDAPRYLLFLTDCNENGVYDACDISSGASLDCNGNDYPDECDPDNDADGIAETCDPCPGDAINDPDGDQVCGCQDNCPYAYNPGQEDSDGDGFGDSCIPPNALDADSSGINKARFLSFVVPASSTAAANETALRVNLVSLHHVNPPYTAGSSIPFSSFEGQVRWAGPPTEYVESVSSGTPFYATPLQCDPYYQDWSTVGLLHVFGSAIVPSSMYEVENVAASCQGSEENCTAVSAHLSISTTRWGDVVEPFNPPSTTSQPDFGDIGALVNKFKSAPGAPIKARALLAGTNANGDIDPTPDLGFTHISACVDAFKGFPYPYAIASCP